MTDALTAMHRQAYETEQILGRALEYPEYPEEWETPPGDVCVGEHALQTLAGEAAEKIHAYKALLATEAGETVQRITELEADLASARAAEQSERERRETAEASRDQWVSIAQGKPWTKGKTRLFGDPQLAIDAAYAAERRTRRRLDELQSTVLRQDQMIAGLVGLIRLLPKLPVKPGKLHPDVALAVRWALSEAAGQRVGMLDAPAVPAGVLQEFDAVAAEWEEVRRYSMAQVEKNPL